MQQVKIAAVVLLAALVLCSCGAGSQPSAGGSAPDGQSSSGESAQPAGTYQKITPQQGREMIDAGGVTLVDVRTAGEYAQGHIPGAILVPNDIIASRPPEKLPDKSAPIILYCRSGSRSKQAADKLLAIGYRQVYDMGGIIDWPYDTVTGGESAPQ
ncbi:rhodanese-like domain-containing protein [Neobittarella massiliensis]|uniref:rhodanese-like domain-containing protein n=1 Tax=Neobittarella massiliensis (ex Bilen et al. 2018) TaxID=2041842 RepID=UPI000CF69F5D|nr:rhodanese-like domain-containing protein [Neobittarella massiliensis]